MMLKPASLAGAFLVASLLAAPTAHAQAESRYSVRGFGGWAFAASDNDNSFGYVASERGDWKNYYLALNVAAQPTQKLSIRSEGFWSEDQRGARPRLDYVFAQWAHSPAIKLRVGKAPVPFGIYSEVYDVGTLRPFQLLPQFYEGPLGLIPKAYLGAGLTGAAPLGEDWEIHYDAFGGEIRFEPFQTDFVAGIDPATGIPLVRTLESQIVGREMAGGRLLLVAPVKGIDIGGTVFYLNDVKQRIEGGALQRYSVTDNSTHLNARAQYQREAFGARAEWFGVLADDADVKSFYVEASYKLGRHWQVAGQYETSKIVLRDGDDSIPEPIRRHQSFGLAVNYWLRPELVLKLNAYRVDGNMIARPGQAGLRAALGTINEKTSVVVAGAQFSF
jgi:hypothetical protein